MVLPSTTAGGSTLPSVTSSVASANDTTLNVVPLPAPKAQKFTLAQAKTSPKAAIVKSLANNPRPKDVYDLPAAYDAVKYLEIPRQINHCMGKLGSKFPGLGKFSNPPHELTGFTATSQGRITSLHYRVTQTGARNGITADHTFIYWFAPSGKISSVTCPL